MVAPERRPSNVALMDIVAPVTRDRDGQVVTPFQDGVIIDRSDCLPPDLDYCLDAEQELGSIGHDDRAFVDLFDSNIFNWFMPLTRGGARAFPDIIKTRHTRWREMAPIEQRMALTWGGLEALKWLFNDCVSNLAYQIVHDHGVSDFPDGTELGYLESVDISADPGLLRFADCARPIVARAVQDIAIAGPEAFLAAHGSLDALYASARDRLRERTRRINEMLRRCNEEAAPRSMRGLALEDAPPVHTAVQKRREKGLRKAIARSYRLLGSIAGAETARACLDGEQITVRGSKFDFRLRVANLRSTAHGAIEVFVTDKEAVELASLCVYIDQTPALDQMAALILDVTAGNEDKIIRRANVIRSTEAATRNEAFLDIRKAVERVMRPVPIFDGAHQSQQSGELLPALERRLGDAIEVAAWRPLIEIFGPGLTWKKFSSTDWDELVSGLVPFRGTLALTAAP
jgi:hypothetical protein